MITYRRAFASPSKSTAIGGDTPVGRLANMLLAFFSCPTSETSCERIYSLMRIILTDKRQNMSVENLFCAVQVRLGPEEKKKQ
jgi:hypothetical protein